MPPAEIKEPFKSLEGFVIETMKEGVKKAYGLDAPKSYSDWTACVRALFTMFKVERRALSLSDKDLFAEE